MSDIVIEKVQRSSERPPSLVEQVDILLDALRATARKLWGDSDERRVFDRWLQAERQKFWEEQCELIEGHECFRIRMAVPGPDVDQLRVVVSMDSIEIRTGGTSQEFDLDGQNPGHLIRRMILSAPVNPGSVSAILDQRELRLAGATSQAPRRKRQQTGLGTNPRRH
jgi:HSP20 family molecular chaperone IbpA